MNKRVKKLWIKALISGEYKQGRCMLRYKSNGEYKYCCLGVLMDLAVKKGIIAKFDGSRADIYSPRVRTWAGLLDDKMLQPENPIITDKCLSALNDDYNLSFKEIAKLIDKNL